MQCGLRLIVLEKWVLNYATMTNESDGLVVQIKTISLLGNTLGFIRHINLDFW
jgi:hypothetical protein